MKVKVLKEFKDRENDLKLRKKGTTFDAGKERAEKLEKMGYVCIIKPTAAKKG